MAEGRTGDGGASTISGSDSHKEAMGFEKNRHSRRQQKIHSSKNLIRALQFVAKMLLGLLSWLVFAQAVHKIWAIAIN